MKRILVVLVLVLAGVGVAVPVSADAPEAGTFRPWVRHGPPGGGLYAVALADVTGDGVLDAVAPDSVSVESRTLRIYEGDGFGGFGAPSVLERSGWLARSVDTGDFDGDGRADVAVAALTQVDVFTRPDGVTLQQTMSLPTEASVVRVGDLTGDGLDDIAVIGWYVEQLFVHAQLPEGGFAEPVPYAVNLGGFNDMVLDDIDGDGDNDLVAMSGSGTWTPNLTVLLQQDDGTLVVSGEYSIPLRNNVQTVGVGDVDADGSREVVVTKDAHRPEMYVFEVGPDGGLVLEGSRLQSGGGADALEVADLDLDGFDDVVAIPRGWNQASAIYGSPHGLADEDIGPLPHGNWTGDGLDLGDIDGDGDVDAALVDSNGLLILENRAITTPPNLAVSLNGSDVTSPGQLVDVEIEVLSTGDEPMSGALTLTASGGLLIAGTPDLRCSRSKPHTSECTVPLLRQGQTVRYLITVRGTGSGIGSLTATLTASDAEPTDDTARLDVAVRRPT